VCATLFNQKRQLIGIKVFVPSLAFVEVVRPGHPDPFAQEVRAVQSLLQFSDDEPGHRVRISGTVTLQRATGEFFLLDDTGGLYVRPREPVPLRPGDRVDVAGFTATGAYTPVLEDAVVRRTGEGPPYPARPIIVGDSLRGDYDALPVRLEARLVEHSRRATDYVLTLQAGAQTFNAYLEQGSGDAPLPALRNGSLLQLPGIYSVQTAYRESNVAVRGFWLFLDDPGDIVVLKAASWWDFRRALGALGLM